MIKDLGNALLLCLFFSSVEAGDIFGIGKPKQDPEKHRANMGIMASKLSTLLERKAFAAAIVSRSGSDLSRENFRLPTKHKFTPRRHRLEEFRGWTLEV